MVSLSVCVVLILIVLVFCGLMRKSVCFAISTWTETASSIKALPSLSEPLPQNYLGSEVARYHQQ
jgi:hypothetical protein